MSDEDRKPVPYAFGRGVIFFDVASKDDETAWVIFRLPDGAEDVELDWPPFRTIKGLQGLRAERVIWDDPHEDASPSITGYGELDSVDAFHRWYEALHHMGEAPKIVTINPPPGRRPWERGKDWERGRYRRNGRKKR